MASNHSKMVANIFCGRRLEICFDYVKHSARGTDILVFLFFSFTSYVHPIMITDTLNLGLLSGVLAEARLRFFNVEQFITSHFFSQNNETQELRPREQKKLRHHGDTPFFHFRYHLLTTCTSQYWFISSVTVLFLVFMVYF